MEFIKEKNILIDGAHNPDSAKKLAESLNYYFPKQRRIFIYGTLNTKDYKTIAKILFKPDDEIYYNEFHHNNAVSYSEYKRNINIPINLNKNSSDILKRKELKIITGSLYMIGEYLSKFFNS